ncbi:MAG: hypothetical protein ABJP70_05660 [Erythrobacter sp.]
MRTHFLIVLLFALAACGGAEKTDDAATDGEAADDTALANDADETVKDEDDATSSEEASTKAAEAKEQGAEPLPADQKKLAGEIPVVFHGVWDATSGSCSPESDARIQVSAKEVRFYESIGTVTSVAANGDKVNVAFDMEGEGETWTETYEFIIIDGLLKNLALDTEFGIFDRKRCPN